MLKKLLAFTCLTISIGANAATIVDTGPGPSGVGGYSLDSGQWLAAEFTISQQYTVTDIQGWIGGWDGTATVAMYSDGGSVPGTELFSAGFSASNDDDWYGASGLSLLLDAGTYWAAFEVRAGDTYSGYMSNPAPSPLGAYAGWNTENGWYGSGPLNFGVRISSVPLPTAAWLFGSALLGLGAFKRKKAA